MEEGPLYPSVGLAACQHLSAEDCAKHPSCSWVHEFEKATGTKVAARCQMKGLRSDGGVASGRAAKITRKSPKRSAAGRGAAAKNPWLAHVKRVRATLPAGTPYKDVLQQAKSSYVKQSGAGYWRRY